MAEEFTGESMTYRVLPTPTYKPSAFALARRYSDIADAVSDMGDGVVVRSDGELAAFHERHLPFLVRCAGRSDRR